MLIRYQNNWKPNSGKKIISDRKKPFQRSDLQLKEYLTHYFGATVCKIADSGPTILPAQMPFFIALAKWSKLKYSRFLDYVRIDPDVDIWINLNVHLEIVSNANDHHHISSLLRISISNYLTCAFNQFNLQYTTLSPVVSLLPIRHQVVVELD